jgi:hypothetical protein
MAGRAINVELNDGRVVKVVFNQKGLIDLTPYMKVEVILPAEKMAKTRYQSHFKMASEALFEQTQKGPILRSQFTEAE